MGKLARQTAKIGRYVRFAQSLPTELSAVKVYIGFETTNVPVLSPESMQALFLKIRKHADLWLTISKQSKDQLRELSITAADVVKNGNGLIRGLNALGPVSQIVNTVGASSLDEGDFEKSDKPLDKSTISKLNNLQPYIDILHATSLSSLEDSKATIQKISEFRTESSTLESGIANVSDKVKEGSQGKIGSEKTIEPMIDAFKEARDRIIAQFGQGSDAARAIQEQIDKTLSELAMREAGLQEQQRLTYAAGRLFIHFQDLGYAILDAQSALTNIWLTSSKTCTRLTNITSDLQGIHSEEMLLNFYVDYVHIIKDWTAIKAEASDLYADF